MTLRKTVLSAVAAGAAALSISALPATVDAMTINVGTLSPSAYFFLTSGTAESPSITATFGATPSGSFDDSFTFELLQDGTGSGSVSTSFSGLSNELTISDVLINGATYTAAQAAAGVGGIPIVSGVENVIEVVGSTAPGATGTFSGTATFVASAAPEPSTWILMIGGIGLIGASLRRRLSATQVA